VRLQQGHFVAEVLLRAETHDATGRGEPSTTWTDLRRVKEEEAGVEKRCCARISAKTVSPGDIGLEDSVKHVKEAEAQTIAGVRVGSGGVSPTARPSREAVRSSRACRRAGKRGESTNSMARAGPGAMPQKRYR